MSPSTIDRFHLDPENWKLGIFYFCRADQRMVVPKRIRGLGWTINFARPLAVPFLAFLIALVLGIIELSHSFVAGSDARFAVKLLLALGIIALCYRLSNPPMQNSRPDSGSDKQNV